MAEPTTEFERLRQGVTGGGTPIPTGTGIPSGTPDAGDEGDPEIIKQAVAAGLTREAAYELWTSGNAFDLQRLQEIISSDLSIKQQRQKLEPQPPRDFNRSLEDLQVQAIIDGDNDQAIRLRRFQQAPSDIEALNAAIRFATSPADAFTLSAIAAGQSPIAAPSPGTINPLPRSPFLQDTFNRVFGPQGGIPSPGPTIQDQQAQAQMIQAQQGGQPVPPQVNPEVQQQPFGPQQPQLPQSAGFTPAQVQFAAGSPGETLRPEDLARLTQEQVQFLGGNVRDIPTVNAPAFGSFVDPTPPEQRVSAGLRPEDVRFGTGTPGAQLAPDQLQQLTAEQVRFLGGSTNPTIAPGTPTGSINFGGQNREVPLRIGSVLRGEGIDKPQSFLGAVGLPSLSQQTLGEMTAAERDVFNRLAQEAGLDPRDVERELRNTAVAGLPRPNFRQAARR